MLKRFILMAALVLAAMPALAQPAAFGTITANGGQVCAPMTMGIPSASVQITGTWTGTITFQGTTDGSTYVSLLTGTITSATTQTTATSNGVYTMSNPGLARVCATATAWTSGTANLVFVGGGAAGGAGGGGGGGGGAVSQGSSPWVVGFDGTPQPVTQSGTWSVRGLDGSGNPLASHANGGTRALATVLYDGSGNAITSFGGGSGGTAMADDAAFTAATTQGTPAFAMFDDVSPDSVNENDGGVLRMSANRNLYTSIRDAAGNERGANVNASGQLSVTGPVTVASGGIASGALASGSIAAGAMVDFLTTRQTMAAGTAASNAQAVGGQYNSTPITLTNTQGSALQLDANGFLKVNVATGGGSGGTSLADDADFTAGTTPFTPVGGFYQSSVTACTDGDTCAAGITTGRALKVALAAADGSLLSLGSDGTHDTALGTITNVTGPMTMGRASAAAPTDVSADNDAVLGWHLRSGAYVNQPSFAGTLASTGNGASGGGVQRVTIANDSTGVLATVGTVTSLTQFNGNAIALNAGSASAGTLRSVTASDSPEIAHLANLATYLQPGSSTIIRSDNTNNDDETQVKATAGVLLSISGRNANTTTDAFVRCTNATAASTTPGSTAVIYEMMLPFGGGFVQSNLGPAGMTFSTALTCYVATGKAVTDTTDAAQDDVVVNIVYR